MSTPLLNTKPEELPPVPPKPGILATIFRAFQYRDFRLMWCGAFTSTTGAFVQEVAQSWLVYTLTDSAFLLGLTAFLNGAPILMFSLLGGVAADRVDRRKLLLGSQYVQMTSALALALLLWLGVIQIWHIMAAAFVTGMGQAFGGPAYQALIPSLVEERDLPNAIALMSIQFNLARVVGPVVGGLAFTYMGAPACFLINGLTFLAVIFSLFIVHVRFVPKKTEVRVMHSLKEGLRFVFQHHSMLSVVALSTVTAFFAVPLITLLPVFARETYHLEAQGYSTLLSFSGAGAVTGALVVAWLGNSARKGFTALTMQVALALATLGFALSTNLWAGCFFVFLAGGCVLAVFALLNSLVQLLCPEEMRGRIMSVYHTAFRGAMPLGNLAAGSLSSRFGAPLVISVNAAILMMVAGWYLLKDRQVKQL